MEIKDIKFTQKAKMAIYNEEKKGEFLKVCGQKIVDFCTENEIEPIITGIWWDELEAITEIADDLNIDYQEDDGAMEIIYDALVDKHKIYPLWEDSITVDFRMAYGEEREEYLELTDAIRYFLNTDTDIARNLSDEEEQELLDQLINTNALHEIELLGKLYTVDVSSYMGEDCKFRFSIDKVKEIELNRD